MKKIFFITIFIIAVIYIYYRLSGNELNNYRSISEFKKGSVPAEEWFESQRAFPFNEIPNEEYIKSVEYVKKNFTLNPKDNSSAWTLSGPKNIEGRITTIAIHPLNPHIVYTGTANGGVWKSTDFCQSWISVFDDQITSSVGSIAIDPLNPEIIYCGTGEANSLRSYYAGTGIYKSTNGGASWIKAGLDSSYSIGNIAINPVNPLILYAAAGGWTRRKNNDRGIYKSTDGGSSWSRKLFIADSVAAIDVAIDQSNPTKLIAAMWERQRREDYIKYGGPKSGLFVSTDSGESWTQAGGGFPVNDNTLGRISIDISKSNSQIIYALTAATSGVTKGLYRSTNGGSNWTNVNASAAASSNYAWFNRVCKINPENPNVLFCGGLDMEYSNNGGVTLSSINNSHVDQHAVAFAASNPNYIVTGNDGGIDYTTNGGSSWSASTTLPVTQFYAGDIDYTNPNIIFGGTQDNGTVRTTGDISTWNSIYGGDGFYCLSDYSNPMNVYASSQNGSLGRSTDGGNSFSGATSGLDLQYTNWMTPFVMDKNNPEILYCGTYKIFKTTNRMQSWTAISPDLANAHIRNLGTITTVDVSKSNPDVIYCGTDDANVWVTTNGGSNWNKINSGLPFRWVTRVTVHPDSANVCYVTLSGYKVDSTGSHIFRTTNYGANWTSIKGNLPDAPVNDVLLDPLNTNTLYIATDITVMVTTNLGAQWNILAAGIPSNVPCHDITIHAPTRTMVVWTHGRSSFKINLPPVTGIQNSTEQKISDFRLLQNYPNPFNPVTNLEFGISKLGFVSLKVYDLLGKEVAVLVNEKLSPGIYKATFNGSNFASGVYFYRLMVSSSNPMEAGEFTDVKRMVLVK